jgi:lia operon protein LiaG
VVLDTGSGSVDLELLTDIDRLEVDTGSGSVTIRAPEDLGASVEIETGSGGIDLDFPLEVRSVRRDRVEGRIGDGRGRIEIDTGSGGVRLLRGSRTLR